MTPGRSRSSRTAWRGSPPRSCPCSIDRSRSREAATGGRGWSRQGGAHGVRSRRDASEMAFLFSTSAKRYLDERFDNEMVKSALGWESISNTLAGPSTPGTAYGLLHINVTHRPHGQETASFVAILVAPIESQIRWMHSVLRKHHAPRRLQRMALRLASGGGRRRRGASMLI